MAQQIRDRIKRLDRVPAGSLIPNPKNWRTHSDKQRAALRGIFSEVGIADAAIAREAPDGSLHLIDGHLRTEELTELVPVLVLDVTDEEADKLLLTIDPLAAMAGQDDAALKSLLGDVSVVDDELSKFLSEFGKSIKVDDKLDDADDVEPQLDAAEDLERKWAVRCGQTWEIRGSRKHRLVCGDSTNQSDVEELLGGSVPFIMVTDPPYGVNYDPGWRNKAAAAGHISPAARREGIVENDGRFDWTVAYRLFPGSVAYVWHSGRVVGPVASNLEDAGFRICSHIIWSKPRFAISRGHYHWQHESCWYATRSNAKWCGDRSQSTIWEITNRLTDEEGKTQHGTQKPLECMLRPIRNHGGEDDSVYDPFSGSGTTLLAAERAGRDSFGIEINPRYVAVILQRMSDAGCKCELINDRVTSEKSELSG